MGKKKTNQSPSSKKTKNSQSENENYASSNGDGKLEASKQQVQKGKQGRGAQQKGSGKSKSTASSQSNIVFWSVVTILAISVGACGVFFQEEIQTATEPFYKEHIAPKLSEFLEFVSMHVEKFTREERDISPSDLDSNIPDKDKVDENNNEGEADLGAQRERERQEEEERQRKLKEDEERQRKLREEEERLKKQRKEEELLRKKKEEEERQRKQKEEEERQRKQKEEEERQRKQKEEEERQRKQKEEEERQRKQKEEEERQRKQKEEERQRKQKEEEERQRKQKEEEERQRKQKEEERQRKQKEEEERQRKQKEEEERLRKQKEEEERQRKQKEEEEKQRKQKEEEEKQRKEREEEEKQRKQREEEKQRKKKEEEERQRKQKEEEERQRKQKEEEERQRKQKEEEERQRKQKEEEERQRKQKEEEERQRKQKEEEERQRKQKEEEEKQRKQKEEEEKQRKQKEEEEKQRKQKEEEEKQRKQKEEEEKQRKQREEAEKQKKEEERAKKEKEEKERKEKEKSQKAKQGVDRASYTHSAITNNADLKITAELDEADGFLEKEDLAEALKKYDAILSKASQSPRAHFGKGLTLDKLGFKHQSNEYLEQAINFLSRTLALPDVPDELFKMAGKKLADRQQFRGWGGETVKTYKKLVKKFPEDLKLQNEMGVSYMMIGQNERAKDVFKQVLTAEPSSGFAKAHMGFILKDQAGQIEEAVRMLREGVRSEEEGTQDGRFFLHLGDLLIRLGKTDEARQVYQEGEDKGLFLSAWQRSLYNVDGLTGRPWWTVEQTGYTSFFKALKENWKTIRDEGLAQLNAKTGAFQPEDENLRDTGDWKQFTLFSQGRKNKGNCQKAPKICALIEQFPSVEKCTRGQVKFSVMSPGIHVWPHTGPTNCRIRSHLGLVVPQGPMIRVMNETKKWKEGELLIFDDSFEHEVWHEGSELRLVLIVDVWHPELTQHQRRTLSPI